MINFDFTINSASGVPCLMLQVESSLTEMGITNLECAVLPLGSSNQAIPLDATFKTISPLDFKAADIVFHKNVFPVPPYL